MKKLRLDLDALMVDTFGVLPEGAESLQGTVDGRMTGFRGSACGDCGGGGDDPDLGGTDGSDAGSGPYPTERYSECAPVVESMMDWYTCGYQQTC